MSHLIYNFVLNPSSVASSNPFRSGSIETIMLERQTAPSWWGCLCDVGFAGKKKAFRAEFFVPARTRKVADRFGGMVHITLNLEVVVVLIREGLCSDSRIKLTYEFQR